MRTEAERRCWATGSPPVIPSARLSNAPGLGTLTFHGGMAGWEAARLFSFLFQFYKSLFLLFFFPHFFFLRVFFFSLHSFLPKFIYLFFF